MSKPPSKPVAGEMFIDTPFRKSGRGLVNKAGHVILAREKGELDLVDRKIFNYLTRRSSFGQSKYVDIVGQDGA